MTSGDFWAIVIGFTVGYVVLFLFVMLTAPLYIPRGMLTNKPTKEGPSGFHLFTFIEPGKVKIIVRGERVVRMVMDTANKKFARIGDRQGPEYWEIIDGQSEDPIADIHPLLRLWARYVFKTTGAVFTGIYPFQRVREYELERTAIAHTEPDDRNSEISGEKKTNIRLEVKTDFSDHYRQRTFLFTMNIKGAETKDKIPLDILGVAEMYAMNPFNAAFGTDRWDQAVVNMTTDAISSKTKTLTLDQALTAKNKTEARKINAAVLAIKDDTEVCGIEITGFRILEINPVLTADGLTAIQAEAFANQKGKATRIDGSNRAEALKELNLANQVGDLSAAIATMQNEGLVRAAEAVGKNGGTTILMPGSGSSTDATQVAILAELKKLNKDKV